MTIDQTAAPLLQALQALSQQRRAAFHTPGHRQGRGASPELVALLGEALRADLPELPELDNLFAPEGVLQEAQNLAAEAFGAEQTWFLANGSTCGIEAAVLAVCNPGDKLILPRNVHQSVVSALILSGALPVWVEPDYDADWGIAGGFSPARLAAALAAHPDAKGILLVSPTYHGVCSDLVTLAEIAHQHNLPLLVDEAHGAHFAFHPDLPITALAAGADLTVQSIHKTLPALTQAAMLHVQHARINRQRLSQALQIVQSSSPNYLLLASLDAARRQMATTGKALLETALQLAATAKTQLQQIPGLMVLTDSPQLVNLDPTRLTVDVRQFGLTGFAADEFLHQTCHVTAELPALTALTFIITSGNTPQDITQLVTAFQTLAEQFPTPHPPYPSPPAPHPPPHTSHLTPHTYLASPPPPPSPPLHPSASSHRPPPLSPRTAFFSPTLSLPLSQTVGKISAESICPYPPGIPVLFPGEVVSAEAICYLQEILTHGGMLTGCSDPNLATLKVVASAHS